jgi:hypothetical protein
MTLKEFADRFGVKHPAVVKWERSGDAPTRMAWSTEKDIRLFVYQKLGKAEELASLYESLAIVPRGGVEPLKLGKQYASGSLATQLT